MSKDKAGRIVRIGTWRINRNKPSRNDLARRRIISGPHGFRVLLSRHTDGALTCYESRELAKKLPRMLFGADRPGALRAAFVAIRAAYQDHLLSRLANAD